MTDVDHAVQDILLERIGREFPSDAVITEETQKHPERHAAVGAAARCWVIDPIDGTRNYARGFPLFSVSVALMEAGRPVLGVIHNPMTGNMYSASAGGGAWLDGAPMKTVDQPQSSGTLIGVPSARRAALPEIIHRWIDRMVLRNGSTLHLALVASGRWMPPTPTTVACGMWPPGRLLPTRRALFIRPLASRTSYGSGLYTSQDVPFTWPARTWRPCWSRGEDGRGR